MEFSSRNRERRPQAAQSAKIFASMWDSTDSDGPALPRCGRRIKTKLGSAPVFFHPHAAEVCDRPAGAGGEEARLQRAVGLRNADRRRDVGSGTGIQRYFGDCDFSSSLLFDSTAEWSAAFGGVPVYVHEADRNWVMRPADCLQFWGGETKDIGGGLTLFRCGGHFEGGQVLHSADGALFTGDVIQVCPDRRWVSFMRSYPNYIPLPEKSVLAIVGALERFEFDRLYGAWPKHEIVTTFLTS